MFFPEKTEKAIRAWSRRGLATGILVLAFSFPFVGPVAAATLARASGYVSDYAGVLDARTRGGLNELLTRLERRTGAELAIVTVKTLDGGDMDTFANELFTKWGIGKKGKDNGVLIAIAIQERKWRIEVGYGLEGALPDGLCGEIAREYMVPHFQQGEFGKGLVAGALSVATVMAKEAGVSLKELGGPSGYAPGAGSRTRQRRPMSPLAKGIRIVFFIIMIPVVIRNPWLLLFMMGGRGGGWSGGGFGGGFGGFGGGMSGGGGAGGGW